MKSIFRTVDHSPQTRHAVIIQNGHVEPKCGCRKPKDDEFWQLDFRDPNCKMCERVGMEAPNE